MKLLRCFVVREDDQYVSFCIENCISSFGSTPREAANNLEEAINLTLAAEEEAERRGERVGRVRAPWYWAWRLLWWLLYSVLRRRLELEDHGQKTKGLQLATVVHCAT